MDDVELLVVGCGPAGATAAREASRRGLRTLVLDKDAIVGQKRVCAAGLRPGFCTTFDLPRSLIHCDTPRLALFDASGDEYAVRFGPGHTSTREELDGTMATLARASGAEIRTSALFRSVRFEGDAHIVEYADLAEGERRKVRAQNVLLVQGATARLDDVGEQSPGQFADPRWEAGLMTTLQHRVYLDRPAAAIAYETLELHFYPAMDGRMIVAWMFPKRDHLAIGLGVVGKMRGSALRDELSLFVERTRRRLYPDATVTNTKEEGHILYGGWPRERIVDGGLMVGGTAAGLVDATNGEGIYEAAMSGRIAAECVAIHRNDPGQAARSYSARVHERFYGKLRRRVSLMRFLEARPQRFTALFEQFAGSPAFATALHKERHERSFSDRALLLSHAVRFLVRAVAA